jgi:primosomal protein N' (replication factor Y) (superfamily II helicase)
MSKPLNLIDVAIPVPVESPFTYSVPDELMASVEIGKRVLAPFRNKMVSGFVVGYPAGDAVPEKLREIIDIPDEPPYLTANLWRFICWISDYYLLPSGLALRTALPPGSNRRSKPWAILTSDGRKRLSEQNSGSPDLPGKIVRTGFMSLSELTETLDQKQLDEATNSGWIRIEERIARPRISLRRRRLPGLLDPAGTATPPLESPLEPTPAQRAAIDRIREVSSKGGFHSFLLFGVTGSGKTEVYLRVIEDALQRGERALVLVPEIALTPQLARRFLRRLGAGVGLFHSGLTRAQRLDEWRRMRSGKINVVIGARSAIFAPLENLGLIIVDEEHDPSYKQEDSCPYNARDMALARGNLEGARVILGSATPSFETFVNAQRGKITRLDLPSRPHGGGLPTVELVDLKVAKGKRHGGAFLTPVLVEAIGQALAAKEQVVLFLNRRGFDTFTQCRSCGHVFKCPNCDISVTHHKRDRALRCHLCGFSQVAPPLCPNCSSEKLLFGGVGTEKVVEEVSALFPQARVERLDRDSTRRRNELESILERFRKKEIDVLAGTQMIVKGHDFPGITLVGVLCGDLSLHFPDFRAAERTFQMLTQVAGRTGRETDCGRVILQTFDPNHQVIQCAASHAFEDFFQNDSIFRRELLYPPFGHLILIRIEGNSEKRVENKAIEIGRAARMLKKEYKDVAILGPAPAPRKKMVGRFRWQVLFKAGARAPVRNLVKDLMSQGNLKAHGLRIIVDVDPVELM